MEYVFFDFSLFFCMTVRTKDGKYESTPWPIILNNNHNNNNNNIHNHHEMQEEMNDLQHNLHLYLTVMTRITSAFADLTKSPPSILLSSTTATTGGGGSSSSGGLAKPITWKTELLKGFVYPPSATIFSTAFWNDGEDCSSGQRIGDLTSPPIVEIDYVENDDGGGNSSINGSDGGLTKTVVRITLQGIHSGGLEIMEDGDEFREVRGGGSSQGMVPVSLVFEACFGDNSE